MKIKRSELLEALELVKPGLAGKEMIEQSTSFAFMDDQVVTYNDEISVSHPVPGLGIEGAVKADALYQLLNKSNSEEVDITVSDTEVKLRIGRGRAGLVLEQEIRLPLNEVSAVGEWKPLPKDFLKALTFVIPTCATDMSAPVFTCVHMRQDGWLEATDRQQLTQHHVGGEMPCERFLLPASEAKVICRYDVTHISYSKNWVHFKTEAGTQISCRVFAEEFPNTAPIMEEKDDFEKVSMPSNLEEVLDRAQIFADESLDALVGVEITTESITVSGKGECGWFEERISCNNKIECFFRIPPRLLKMCVTKGTQGKINDRQILLTGDGWAYTAVLQVRESER